MNKTWMRLTPLVICAYNEAPLYESKGHSIDKLYYSTPRTLIVQLSTHYSDSQIQPVDCLVKVDFLGNGQLDRSEIW